MKTYSSVPGAERVQHVPCNLCGSERIKPYFPNLPFVKCLDCGLVFQNPQPLVEDLAQRYGKEYFAYEIENEKNFFKLIKLSFLDIDFYNLEKKLLGGYDQCLFLDIGCATGLLLEFLQKRGWLTRGVEICRESAIYGRKNRAVDIHIGTLEDAHFPDNQFHVVHGSHLIEHLTDPKGFIREVYRVLKPGGYFIITTPNIAGFQSKIFKEKWRSAIMDHLFLFSKKTLGAILKQEGFNPLAWKTWGGLAKDAPFSVFKPLFDRLAKTFGWGDVMIYLARKV